MNQKSILLILNSVTRDTRLKHYEVRIFNALVSYNGYGKIFPSLETISKDTGIKSKSDISKALTNLEKLGYINKTRRKYNSNIYEIRGVDNPTKKTRPGANKPTDSGEATETTEQNPYIDYLLNNKEFLSTWNKWKSYLKQKGIAVTEMTFQEQLKMLWRQKRPIACINNAIFNGWKNIYPLDEPISAMPELMKNEHGDFLINPVKQTIIKVLEDDSKDSVYGAIYDLSDSQQYRVPKGKANQGYKIDTTIRDVFQSMRVETPQYESPKSN